MAAPNDDERGEVRSDREILVPAVHDEEDRTATAPGLSAEQVWHDVGEASFAVLSYITPSGEPRSSGVVYETVGSRLYVATAPGSWKARHIAASGQVAVTVPLRRGGVLALAAPIPPATVSFHGSAIVHQPGSPRARALVDALSSLLTGERGASSAIIEVVPEGTFVTYGLRVPLMKLRDPLAAGARVPMI